MFVIRLLASHTLFVLYLWDSLNVGIIACVYMNNVVWFALTDNPYK